MKTKIDEYNINDLEPLHLFSLELAKKFNALYWQTDPQADNEEVLDALDEYRSFRRIIKNLNGGEPYRPWEAHAIMSKTHYNETN